jgi:hypothetical protein
MISEDDDDVTSAHADAPVHGISRVLKKKRKKNPKGGKVSKSAKSLGKVSKSAKGVCSEAAILSQKAALLALKEGFDDGDEKLANWVDSNEPCSGDFSNWSYITCKVGKVIIIDFNGLSLTGSISPLIGCPTTLVSSMTDLDFGYNSLSGTIPAELGALSSLTYLAFTRNNLSGSIPTELSKLTSLTVLAFGM